MSLLQTQLTFQSGVPYLYRQSKHFAIKLIPFERQLKTFKYLINRWHQEGWVVERNHWWLTAVGNEARIILCSFQNCTTLLAFLLPWRQRFNLTVCQWFTGHNNHHPAVAVTQFHWNLQIHMARAHGREINFCYDWLPEIHTYLYT